MKRLSTPFRLTTRYRGWLRISSIGLVVSLVFNISLILANVRLSSNLSTPRVVVQSPSGIMLPLAANAFVWTPQVARDFVSLFLPVLYTFSPDGPPDLRQWSPFIHPGLLQTAKDRYIKNQGVIKSEGLCQTLHIQEVIFGSDVETAKVTGEIRILNRQGEVSKTIIQFEVKLSTNSDPLNAYGHLIQTVQ